MRGVLRTQFTRFVNAPTKIHVIFLISPISLLEMVSFLYFTFSIQIMFSFILSDANDPQGLLRH